MSATSKRDRALQAGVEPVTDKAIHTGDEPMPDYLDVNMADPEVVAPIEEPVEALEPDAEEQESDDG